mgnify:CR=1 FL=1
MKKIFVIECNGIEQHTFELIHRYIRKTLEKNNQELIIKSIDITPEIERLIFTNSDRC